ncbi:Uncharacterised protein [Anaerococcus prevotii]|uniref:Uncharacterized protein n=1 Tax=Anaerococcus prevotii (strain ATCC 9321 / DSM 20548 / JCM 6508 / NCTC 11806 / PC1) TaxID=525919 RepID=C7RH82_ANAPD|nr:hypothetical protein Apre_0815 [Anaerococcus prevotii DSM 20548]SUU94518.1 Uncharacterised protein [Anaerococcus prevotii]
MSPQMIRVLTYFMAVYTVKQGCEIADMKKAKMVSGWALVLICLRFLFLVYRQWSYLG